MKNLNRISAALIVGACGARPRLVATALATTFFAVTGAHAATFPPIPDLSPYAIVSVGPQAALFVSSGPIIGQVLVGDGSSTVTANAFTEAQNLQNALDGLTATQTFGDLDSFTTITGDGGLNVIDVTSLTSDDLTLSGGADDIFVLRVSGDVADLGMLPLKGGLTADHVIWDLDSASGFVLDGGHDLFGTFLDTRGGDFRLTDVTLTGQLINTDGFIAFGAGTSMTASPFSAPAPEPATWALMLVGFGGLGMALRSRRKAAVLTV